MKTVIYTCITGDYDNLLQPVEVDPEFDYICFVRKGEALEKQSGVWQIRELPKTFRDDRLASRWPKILPHKALKDYDCSLWLDGNVQIASSEVYDILREKVASGVRYSGISHPLRDCVYDEAKKCFKTGRISIWGYLRALLFLRTAGYPHHTGLMENNVIFRRHADPAIKDVDDSWWSRFRRGPRRDQLSLMVCLDRFNVMRDYFLPRGISSRNSTAFNYFQHNETQN